MIHMLPQNLRKFHQTFTRSAHLIADLRLICYGFTHLFDFVQDRVHRLFERFHRNTHFFSRGTLLLCTCSEIVRHGRYLVHMLCHVVERCQDCSRLLTHELNRVTMSLAALEAFSASCFIPPRIWLIFSVDCLLCSASFLISSATTPNRLRNDRKARPQETSLLQRRWIRADIDQPHPRRTWLFDLSCAHDTFLSSGSLQCSHLDSKRAQSGAWRKS